MKNRPSTRLLVSLLSALMVLTPARPALASKAELDEATQQWKSLSEDASRRRMRHHWEKVIRSLEKASASLDACSNKQLGLLRAARATEELAKFSALREDLVASAKRYVSAGDACPKGRLADDAYVDAARIQAGLKDLDGQRSSLERAVAAKGDLHSEAVKILATLPQPARESKALSEATERYEQLKNDKKQRFFRHNWLTAIRRFEQAAKGGTPRENAVALMRAAKASEELSRISKRSEDAERAVELYVMAADKSPKESLVDDALVEAASIQIHRLGDTESARTNLQRAVSFNGDMKAEAARLLASLPPPPAKKAKPEPKPAPAPVVAEAAHDHAHEHGSIAALEPASPDALIEATFSAEDFDEEGMADLGALMAKIDNATRSAERQTTTSNLKALKNEALGGEWSLSEQLGAKVRRVVLDAGHGGHDSGAIGPTGVKEKDVTLAITKQLAELLRGRGYEVLLTRDTDRFLALEERTKIANAANGDLFISIHANAHNVKSKGGIETYALNVASDRFAMRLAARENASTERSVGDLQFLLADLATRANTADSDRLASSIQQSLVSTVRKKHGEVRDLGVKHALFYVLLGARMPAVLVETAFVSNPREEKWLASPAFQSNVAQALAEGIERFVERRSMLASIDN